MSDIRDSQLSDYSTTTTSHHFITKPTFDVTYVRSKQGFLAIAIIICIFCSLISSSSCPSNTSSRESVSIYTAIIDAIFLILYVILFFSFSFQIHKWYSQLPFIFAEFLLQILAAAFFIIQFGITLGLATSPGSEKEERNKTISCMVSATIFNLIVVALTCLNTFMLMKDIGVNDDDKSFTADQFSVRTMGQITNFCNRKIQRENQPTTPPVTNHPVDNLERF
ncbi:hypothetical protein SNEBB_007435 [Seison nebaliae]|nr:hypothetical protein SNEBB_007435 [Seison nebaliae]